MWIAFDVHADLCQSTDCTGRIVNPPSKHRIWLWLNRIDQRSAKCSLWPGLAHVRRVSLVGKTRIVLRHDPRRVAQGVCRVIAGIKNPVSWVFSTVVRLTIGTIRRRQGRDCDVDYLMKTSKLQTFLALSAIIFAIEYLRKSGVHAVQGYIYAQPMPASDLMKWVEEHEMQPAGIHGGSR
jgi:hypothetical protein